MRTLLNNLFQLATKEALQVTIQQHQHNLNNLSIVVILQFFVIY